MASKLFVDTSFIIALINDKDQHHSQALALSREFEDSPLITTDAVLLEIGNALARDFRTEAIEVIRILRSAKNVLMAEIDNALFEKGMAVYEKYGDKD